MGEVARQALIFAIDMQWIALTESQETKLLQLVSLVPPFERRRVIDAV